MATRIKIDYSRYINRMSGLVDKLAPFFKVMGGKIAQEAHRFVTSATPPTRPGRTDIKKLWVVDQTREGTIESYIVRNTYSNPDVITFFEEGTRPHRIKPKNARRLHFVTYEGDEVYAKLVHHPGTPAYHMVEQAQRETNLIVDRYVELTLTTLNRVLDLGGRI